MFRISSFALKLALSIFAASVFAGCAASQPVRPTAGFGKWESICTHPTMTEAAYREAFACHRAAQHAALRRTRETLRLAPKAAPRVLIAAQ